ncbi:MAG: hypothetical protein MRY21_07085 [Simkaniaceae bacterium]|nr:hypothetical protein [Simkaniaceae bacterium]
MKRLALLLLLVQAKVFALVELPWLTEPYLFHFRPAVEVGYYPSIESRGAQIDSSNTLERAEFNLGVAFMSNIDVQAELELYHSQRLNFNFQSFATSVRMQFLDDIAGDPVSLTAGVDYRVVPFWRLKDPGVPYHFVSNFQLNSAVGKEISRGDYWIFRTYGVAAIGMANKGYPWFRLDLNAGANFANRHRLDLDLKTYIGFGYVQAIDVNTFDGYYDIAHRSIDAQIAYRYHFQIYGTLSLEGLYRIYAHSYPSDYRAVIIRYDYPFSLF